MPRLSSSHNGFRPPDQADQVIVIDNGKIVGVGTHESLLADCATYAEFAASQSVSAGVGGTP